MIIVEQNVINSAMANAVYASWPNEDWRGWHHYSGTNSEKWASKSAEIPKAAEHALHEMVRFAGARVFPGAFPDWELYGAGLHMIKPGGYLRPHLDSSVMEATGWRREYSCVLCVNPTWEESWGGRFRLKDHSYLPAFNQMILFRCTEDAVHEVEEVTGQEARKTLSVFFWSLQEVGNVRTAAEFTAH